MTKTTPKRAKKATPDKKTTNGTKTAPVKKVAVKKTKTIKKAPAKNTVETDNTLERPTSEIPAPFKPKPRWNMIQYVRSGTTQISGSGINRTVANADLKALMPLIKHLIAKEDKVARLKPDEIDMIIIMNSIMVEVYPSNGGKVRLYNWLNFDEKILRKLELEIISKS